MKKIVFYFIGFSFITLEVFAEGPPVNYKNEITEDYTAIALTKKQKEDLNYCRVIVLNTQQKNILKEIINQDYLYILGAHYNDCTCGLRYGIWFHEDSVGVPNYIKQYKENDEQGLKLALESGDTLRIEMAKRLLQSDLVKWKSLREDELTDSTSMKTKFYISLNGDVFYKKQKIEKDSLTNIIWDIQNENRDENAEEEVIIYVYWPPVYNNKYKLQVLETYYLFGSFTFERRDL